MYSEIEKHLERSIYHAIRKKAIEFGYALDLTTYQLTPEGFIATAEEQARYDADLSNLRASKGFAIEIFGYSNNHNVGRKKPPSIVIETESFLPGMTGLDRTPQYVKNIDGTFSVKQGPSLTSDLFFSVKVIANTVEQMRVLHQIKVNSIPRLGYMPWYFNDGLKADKNIMVKYDSMADVSWLDEGIIEKVYRYEIVDAHEVEDDIINDRYPAIKEITLDINGDNITKIV